jgi:hypothetical protein
MRKLFSKGVGMSMGIARWEWEAMRILLFVNAKTAKHY